MPAFRLLLAANAFVLWAGLFLASARGEVLKATGSDTNFPPLIARFKEEIVPGFPPITRAIVSAGTNEFAFLVPRDFRIDASDPEKIKLVSTNEITFITVRLLHPFPAQAGGGKKKSFRELYRDLLLAERPGVKILSEFTRTADGRSGPAFDFQWAVAGSAIQSARTAFIPSPAGVLEFRLNTRLDRFRRATYKFNNVLLSFRASKNGKLEIAPLSNRF